MPMMTLITGEAVESDSEAWRHECEARMVAALPSTKLRHDYVATVQRQRGEAAAKALRNLATEIRMKRLEEAQRAAGAST